MAFESIEALSDCAASGRHGDVVVIEALDFPEDQVGLGPMQFPNEYRDHVAAPVGKQGKRENRRRHADGSCGV